MSAKKPKQQKPAPSEAPQAPPAKPLSRDQRRMGKFHTFEVSQQRFENVKKLSKKMMVKYFTRGIIFGFLLELMITQTRIYDNIIRSTTMKRLNAKRLQNERLLDRKQETSREGVSQLP